jgi:arylsulfate sulfotransferase
MKKWQKIVFPLAILVVVLLAAVLVIKSGVLVKPTEKRLASDIEVPRYDLLQAQAAREQEFVSDYQAGQFTLQSPYVVVDPYNMNPLSALVIYEAAQPGQVEVTVQGDDAATTFKYIKTSKTSHFEVPIIGLYAGRENTVTLKDDQENTVTLTIATDPLPADFQTFTLEKSNRQKWNRV